MNGADVLLAVEQALQAAERRVVELDDEIAAVDQQVDQKLQQRTEALVAAIRNTAGSEAPALP